MRLLQAGRLGEAERVSAEELRVQPQNAMALYVQGVLSYTSGNLSQAGVLLDSALQLSPQFAEAHFHSGLTKLDQGNGKDAVGLLQQVLNLGLRQPVVYNVLGNALKDQGKLDQAIIHYQDAIRLDGRYYFAWYNIGIARWLQGDLHSARECFQKTLTINPEYYMALDNLGAIHDDLGLFDEAIACYHRSIKINDRNHIVYNNLANALRNKGCYGEAERQCQKALTVVSNFSPAYKNLGVIALDRADVTSAVKHYRKALACFSDPQVHSNLLMTLQYQATISQEDIYSESLNWANQFTTNMADQKGKFRVEGTPKQCLRIGYVSADFKDHSVAYFIEPVLRGHDPDSVEIFCYSNVQKEDSVTERLKRENLNWRDIARMNDQDVADLIMRDRIDILVDLSGHTNANRLLVFARRPAPIQVTWLGYPNTTGLSAMDYRITDEVADPVGPADLFNSETLLRLPLGFLCYLPESSAPAPTEPPCLANGLITFGSFNNLSKINRQVMRLWAEILSEMPESRLILKNKSLVDASTRARFRQCFAEEGGDVDRVELFGMLARKEDHLSLYQRIDIGLDPFPYNGTTTTCEALWMGVPVVTMIGERHSGRVGASILHRIGMDQLVSQSEEGYKKRALSLAGDPERLCDLRSSLRQRMEVSPLMDAQRFSQEIEKGYRKIWLKWRNNQLSTGPGKSDFEENSSIHAGM
ncbi:MAG: tetratricopeptide repeat protein [Proteobacteria bacterium]|nr:tetratricopeptide repeat protein [Pseudomonadota bacterium]MBU1686387.1 tetratricopeptide repeat protein [Pseudomonadota bacterium]